MKYLLDTCIISESMKKEPNKNVQDWIDSCIEEDVFVSVLTFGELQKGVAKLPDNHKKHLLQRWLDFDLKNRFQDRILNLDHEILQVWGQLVGSKEIKGIKIPVMDSLIGATALAHSLVVVTRNTKDIEKCGVKCLDPFLS